MKRNPTIDILRGIAIFLVVFGHISHIGWTKTYIWGFHIPIFFFISGMLFNENKYNSITNFIKSKFKTLIIPYGIFYLTTFTYWLVIERHTRGGLTFGVPLLTTIWELIYIANFQYGRTLV